MDNEKTSYEISLEEEIEILSQRLEFISESFILEHYEKIKYKKWYDHLLPYSIMSTVAIIVMGILMYMR